MLAIARPDVDFVLIEPMERRTDWLPTEAAELGLDNVTVLRARAEDVRFRVTARPGDRAGRLGAAKLIPVDCTTREVAAAS